MSYWEESDRLIKGALRVGGAIAGKRSPQESLFLHESCRSCPRPLRLFGFAGGNGKFATTCAVCKWKRDNKEVTVLLSMRLDLFPLPAHIQAQVMAFLCYEGNQLWVPTSTCRLQASSPHLSCVLSTAISRKWRSILQSDARRLVDFFYCETGNQRLQARYMRSPMRDTHYLIHHLRVRNPIWTLALALHYLAKRRWRMVAGRPLTLLLSYLSPRWNPREALHWCRVF